MRRSTCVGLTAAAVSALAFAVTTSAGPGPDGKAEAKSTVEAVPLAVARDRAKLMHTLYSATLDAVHHHYFRREAAVLPARAMEDVFAEVDRRSGIKSHWVSVNTPAMTIDHEPKTEIEKAAAAELASGKPEFERIENGVYHRAGPIPLGAGCVGCHTKFAAVQDKKPRFSGLIISIPLKP